MKIYVNEIPTEAKECMFLKEEKILLARTSEGAIWIPSNICRINDKECKLNCGEQCDKLIVFDQEK